MRTSRNCLFRVALLHITTKTNCYFSLQKKECSNHKPMKLFKFHDAHYRVFGAMPKLHKHRAAKVKYNIKWFSVLFLKTLYLLTCNNKKELFESNMVISYDVGLTCVCVRVYECVYIYSRMYILILKPLNKPPKECNVCESFRCSVKLNSI